MAEKEIWKPTTLDPFIYVSNLGRFRRIGKCIAVPCGWSGKLIRRKYRDKKPWIPLSKDSGGYSQLEISGKNISVHRVVLQAFIPRPSSDMQCNHKNGIKSDNRLKNLEWVTAKENIHHSIRLGLKKACGGPPKKILPKHEPIIIKMALNGSTQDVIAKKFGVSGSAILKHCKRLGVVYSGRRYPKVTVKKISSQT